MSETTEQLERAFLEAPSTEGLIALYHALQAEGEDYSLAGILDRIRPIQHRVTMVQADAEPVTLEALSRDPHAHVRQVVASHPNITEEVAFRLAEDQQATVRRALRKNPACHPYVAVAVEILDSKRHDDETTIGEHLLEIAWQARQAQLESDELMDLTEEWTSLDAEQLQDMSLDQANLLLEVMAAKQGKRRMPAKPRRRAKQKPARKKRAARS